MKFVNLIVCNVTPSKKLIYKYPIYINVKKIKSFEVIKDLEGKKAIQLNDGKDKYFKNYRYIPFDKKQFKKAFGLDWDEL